MTMLTKLFTVGVVLTYTIFGNPARADGKEGVRDEVLARYLEAKDFYSQRLDLQNVDKALALIEGLADQTDDTALRYDIYDLMSRAYNCKSFHADVSREEKLALYEKGMEAAESAMDENDQLAEAPYLYAVNLGRWGMTKGITDSLGRKDELIENLERALILKSRTNAPGDEFEGYAATMTLGRIYYKLPGFAGGDIDKSIQLLEKAHQGYPQNAENVVYLAEALHIAGGPERQARARQLLDQLLVQDPLTYNPLRPLETSDVFAEGRELRNRMGN